MCKRHGVQRPAIVVGRDTRLSGDMLEAALTAGICSMGGDARLAGILPTPGIALLTRRLGAAAGAVISASHNPFADNGIKFFAADGFKLPDAAEQEIEELVERTSSDAAPTGSALGRVAQIDAATQTYAASLTSILAAQTKLHGITVVVDCGHGAAYRVAPLVFAELGATVVTLGSSPDGENINAGCGALHPETLQAAVRARGAQLGVALDGDADRAMLVDEDGALVDGDEVLAILGLDLHTRGALRHNTVVATVMSNLGLELALRDRGVHLARVQVGDRYVVEEMRQHGYNLGGEQSGHVIVLDHSTTGDGLVAALSVLRVMLERQQPLSRLKTAMAKYPQVLLNVRVPQRRELHELPNLQKAIAAVTQALGDRSRVLVRYSGTEPLLRVMVEGEDRDRVQRCAESIAAAVAAEVGATAESGQST